MKALVRAVFTLFTLIILSLPPLQAASIQEVEQAREKGDLIVADNKARELLQTATEKSDISLEANAKFQLARNAMERNDYPEAQAWLNQSSTLFQEIGDELGMAKTYRQIGLTYRYQSNYSVSLEYLYMALAIYQSQGSPRDLASINNSLGVVLEKMGQFNEATVYHQQALEANYALNDQSGIASALYNLADIRRVMGDYALALDYFTQALEIDEANGNKKDIAYSSYKMGYVNMQMGNYELAGQFMQRAHQLFQEIGAKRDIDWALSGLADLAMRQGKLADAEALARGIIERAKANNYNSLLLDVYQTLIDILLLKKEYAEALNVINVAMELAENINESHKISQLLALKVTASEALADVSVAYEALKRQKELDDTLFNQTRLDALASAQAQTEFVRRANEIERLKQQQALQEIQAKAERENRQMLAIGIVGLAVVAFLLYSRRVQSNYTKQLESEVALRTSELKKANEELAALSLTDKLTGLNNRRFIENQLDADIASVLRKHKQAEYGDLPEHADLCMYVVDLDNFKAINDTFGHTAGDRVLQQTATRLKRIFRESDYLVRWGGEEFVAVARFVNRADAEVLAKRIINDIQNTPFTLDQTKSETITCSVGFACFPFACGHHSEEPLVDMFTAADQCLYAAKQSGRNTWVGVSDINDSSVLPLPSSLVALEELAGQDKLKLLHKR
ncbi:diguanylate cyclase [Alteromonas sediminis]|uniref:diguanylate cyclase n=1 Tax=Alteromonas sediminis TaxID=2259342 RepID=A0A3N5Y2C0_9ALTE|nr:diguanylate cyclase [Alteromonas sediminis]RPJ67997.1 diguanylate cyclase [Alteromonas sediminis]